MSGIEDIIRQAKKLGPIDQNHQCKFCGKRYAKESTLTSHLCEPKRRYQQRNEKGVILGFEAYRKFYKFTQGRENKNYDDFSKSSYYAAFVKFGRYLYSIDAVKPERFTEWIIKNNKKLDQWCKEEFYNEYLLEYIRIENPQDALERSILEMSKWAEELDSVVNHYFRYASKNRIVSNIINGRISPWAIYTSNSGMAMLEKLNEEQLAIIYPWIDPDHWNLKLKRNSSDTVWCKTVMSTGGF
jgi:hypothetical protein